MYRMYGMPRAQDAQERQAQSMKHQIKIPHYVRDDKALIPCLSLIQLSQPNHRHTE